MDWIPISQKPPKIGKYLCWVVESKNYNEHWDIYDWNGEIFIDNGFIGRGQNVPVSHYLIIFKPQQ